MRDRVRAIWPYFISLGMIGSGWAALISDILVPASPLNLVLVGIFLLFFAPFLWVVK